VTRFDPYGDLPRALRIALVALLLVAAVATAGAFAADPEATAPSPAAYDDVVELGLSSETDALMAGSARVPRTQVFYSQLQYVVGYNGVESFAATLDDGRTERQFGYPIAAYVETFDGARPGTIETGLFAAESAGEWTPAAEATYVVGSDARSPAGETVVPFRERGAARRSPPTTADERSTGRRSEAGRSIRTPRRRCARWPPSAGPEQTAGSRPPSAAPTDRSRSSSGTTPTIEAAVAAAPANTTVVVPPGPTRRL